ncbi:MAG: hypothetical protein ACK4RK_08280 [Gemmataceae bacterium]
MVSRRFGWWAVMVSLTALGIGMPARAADVSKYLPSDSDTAVTINVKQILSAPLVQKYLMDRIKKELESNQQAQQVMEKLGFDPLKDVSAIIVAGPMSDLQNQSLPLVIIEGRFDVAKFQALAKDIAKNEAKVKLHRSGGDIIYEIETEDDKPPMFTALLDSGNIVASTTKKRIEDALAIKAGTKPSNPKKELAALLTNANANQSMGLFALNSAIAAGNNATDPKVQQLTKNIKNVTGGITVGNDIQSEFLIHTEDDATAKELSKMINGYLGLFKGLLGLQAAQQPELAPVAELLNTFEVGSTGKTAKLHSVITQSMIEKLIQNVGQ